MAAVVVVALKEIDFKLLFSLELGPFFSLSSFCFKFCCCCIVSLTRVFFHQKCCKGKVSSKKSFFSKTEAVETKSITLTSFFFTCCSRSEWPQTGLMKLATDGAEDRPMRMKSETGDGGWLGTSLGRELEFLISHTVHHYALMAVIAGQQDAALPVDFGLAPSTLKFQRTENAACAR